MANSRKVVQIFLASPGDLQDERHAAKSVVDAFNKRWAAWFDIQIELVGWEDTFKRFGRPQAQINLDLDRCEAFIGLMWRKWGTPPGGEYTSGFEEEFERALGNRKRSTRPEMTIFFKTIDEEFLKDRGPDLLKVLAFRKRVIDEQRILFNEFGSAKDFEDKLTDWITHYVKQLKILENAGAATPETESPSDSALVKTDSAGTFDTPLSPEGAQFIRDFVSKTERNSETHPIDAVEVARLRLLASMIGVAGNDDESLGTHDANLLFQDRDSLILGRREMVGLADCGLDNVGNETVPLWHWYEAIEGQGWNYLPFSTLVGPQSRRVGALIAMRLIGEPITPPKLIGPGDKMAKRSFFVTSWLSASSSENIKTAALEYLSVCGESEDLPALKNEYDKRNYQTVAAAADAIIRINLRQSREKALRAVIELQAETVEDGLIDAIFAKPTSFETKLLLDGVTHRNGTVRARIVPIVAARNVLPTNVAEKLLEDSEARVRFEALRSLEREGREISHDDAKSVLVKPARSAGLGGLGGLFSYAPPPLSDKEGEAFWNQFHVSRLRLQPESALRGTDKTLVISDPAARFALDFKLFRQRGDALRAAIDNGFRSEFDEALEELERLSINTETINKLRSIEDALRKELVRSGTNVLCEKGETEDLERIRRVISTGSVEFSMLDVDFLKKHGEWQDIPVLISLLDRSEATTSSVGRLFDDDQVRSIAVAIYSIGKSRFSELFKEKMPHRLLLRIINLASDKEVESLSDHDLTELYHSEAADLRKAILLRSIKALSKTRLRRLLAAQMAQDRLRYYNISYWLDAGISLSRKQILRVLETANRRRR
ncbi:hypothetical protein ABIA99_003729 [Bradyrhizobium sp. LB12.1]|uniref:DUF4062 domain-containing protein n=1 Tax=Bradyrhizobium sp. LB12.1 TaxID=3156327 RepID=UPI00339A444E